TNLDTSYTRNYIRAEIIPRMKKINPSLESSVLDCSEILREEDGFISGIAEEKAADLFSEGMDTGSFSALPRPLRYRILLEAFRSAGGEALSSVHAEAVFALAEKSEPHSRADLPCGISASVEEGRLRLIRRSEVPEPRRLAGTVPLAEGANRFPEYGFDVFVFRGDFPDGCGFDRNVYKFSIFEKIDFDKIIGSLLIRPRTAGDSYRSRGMTKTVKRMMSEKKLDISLRDRLPLICDSEGILWIPGFPVCDRVYPGRESGSDRSGIATICYAEY
ncbi:MAG: tRNA lysidine(34) synthetase TilS, partial [Clostridia bacterium]|nr:tRNA lysidine(34) synthetase TilS [Clostridia bacterium]